MALCVVVVALLIKCVVTDAPKGDLIIFPNSKPYHHHYHDTEFRHNPLYHQNDPSFRHDPAYHQGDPNFRHDPAYHQFDSGFRHDPAYHANDRDFHHHFPPPYGGVTPRYGGVTPRYGDPKVPDSANEETEDKPIVYPTMIPVNLIQSLNNYTDLNDLLLNFVEGMENDPPPFIANRFGDSGERSASPIKPKPATCLPELRTIKIVDNEDPSVLYFPECTRIERCGGCCSHNLLMCQPVETETVYMQVTKTEFTGGPKFKYVAKEIVPVERHTKCNCSCKIRESDCSPFQVYRKGECRCACVNTDEEKKCYKENATKLWDPDRCMCACRNNRMCSTGFQFDTNRCKCVPVAVRRRDIEEDKLNPNSRKGAQG